MHGVLLLDKPLGLSSNDALQKAKRLYRAEKAGHTGTLDPLATGLLPLCFGAATKFAQVSLDADKRYRATLQLGVTTTTGDAEGEVRATSAPVARRSRAELEAGCARFVGAIEQVPPMHSALKHEGKPLYDYARAGIEVERDAAPRHDPCDRRRRVARATAGRSTSRCSKGTYIRTLAEDIGEALGCGAHLAALRRTAAARCDVDDALHARSARGAATKPSATPRCCRPTRCSPTGRRSSSHADDAGPLPHRPAPPRCRWPTRRACASTGPSRAPSSAAPTSPAAN